MINEVNATEKSEGKRKNIVYGSVYLFRLPVIP